MNLRKSLSLALMGLVSVAMLAGCGTANDGVADKSKPLRVATNATFVPFEFKDNDSDTDYKGFEIDLMKALAKEMGRTLEFNNIPFSGIIPIIQQGDMDIAVAGMTMTPERASKVLFAAPFYESKLVILTSKDSGINSVDDLQGKQVAVQMGTTGSKYAEEKGFQLKQFDHNSEIIMELKVGGSQAGILDKPVADYFLAQEGKDKFKTIDIPDTKSEYLAMAMNKKDTALQKDVNDAMQKLKDSGEFDALYQKWFGEKAPNLPKTAEEALK